MPRGAPPLQRAKATDPRARRASVIHVCHDAPTALREIPPLLAGESTAPASGLGSRATATHTATTTSPPLAVVIGKGFSEAEMATLIERCDAAANRGDGRAAWLLPDDAKITFAMKARMIGTLGTGLPKMVAERMGACLKEHGVVPGSREVKGGVWRF